MKKRICFIWICFMIFAGAAGCGQQAGQDAGAVQADSGRTDAKEDQAAGGGQTLSEGAQDAGTDENAKADASVQVDPGADENDAQKTDDGGSDAEEMPEFMPGYASFDDWRARHLGSVGLITDRTVLVSIYLNEPGTKWDEEDIDYTRERMDIGYGYLAEQMLQYGARMDLIYDSRKNADLFYEMDIEEEIPAYVETEKERELDVEVDKWITQIPVQELMQKYEADSLGFLFFINHEGCSYSSMHFIDDGIDTWDECCMIYLRDMYSKTLEYETPAVYAHELMHLFGAEDLYSGAKVFSPETYAYAAEAYPNDIMIKTYRTIDGKYTIYPDEVVQEISPVTAYLLGAAPETIVRENCPELLREETGCFPGSTYDRPF